MEVSTRAKLSPQLAERLTLLWERTGDEGLHRLLTGQPYLEGHEPSEPASRDGDEQELRDWVCTALMSCYKDTGDAQVFAALYELNEQSFLQAIQFRLRRSATSVDARDVLQEVFLNIYRYPNRFLAEKADSFRNWGHRIVRNTMLKFLKTESRRSRVTPLDEECGDRADARARTPFRSAADSEIATIANQAFLLYLNLYLIHFEQLSAKERRALTLVEVDGVPYKAAAADLGIRLENLKMVIFRGRRKIWRGLNRSLAYLESVSSAEVAGNVSRLVAERRLPDPAFVPPRSRVSPSHAV